MTELSFHNTPITNTAINNAPMKNDLATSGPVTSESLNQAASADRVLDIRDLRVEFDRGGEPFAAVKSLSFHVDRGATVVIVGESGSGKSVTSLAIMRLVAFGGGKIVNGKMLFRRTDGTMIDLVETPEATMRKVRGAEIGMIFQEPMTSLNPVLSVGEQITEAIILHQRKNAQQTLREALDILDKVRIPDAARVMRRYPH